METDSIELKKIEDEIQKDFETTDQEIEELIRAEPSLWRQLIGIIWGIISIGIGIMIIYFFTNDVGMGILAFLFLLFGVVSIIFREVFIGL